MANFHKLVTYISIRTQFIAPDTRGQRNEINSKNKSRFSLENVLCILIQSSIDKRQVLWYTCIMYPCQFITQEATELFFFAKWKEILFAKNYVFSLCLSLGGKKCTIIRFLGFLRWQAFRVATWKAFIMVLCWLLFDYHQVGWHRMEAWVWLILTAFQTQSINDLPVKGNFCGDWNDPNFPTNQDIFL